MPLDMDKKLLYEGVKALVDQEDHKHLQLSQQKLFTLFSISFQYFLFKSTKNPGAYVIRIESSALADKLAKRSKDSSTRRFLQALLLPRKLKYGKSIFFLDFFHMGSWNLTKNIPEDRMKGALIVKDTKDRPMEQVLDDDENNEDLSSLPNNFFLTSLLDTTPETITIFHGDKLESLHSFNFPFIQKEREKALKGVRISEDIQWNEED
ncbi:MAG: hypothetical protein OEY33_01570 [Bdellovibrionales bacterium]|jgi:hypothetical protein|nr:hypothetical protein [Bdellovibrionales bacterium]